MNRLRQCGVLWMLLLVGWTTAPAAACALQSSHSRRPACCRNMPADCSRTMGMNASCCQLRESAPAVEVIPLFSPVHEHDFALVAQSASLHAAPGRGVRPMYTMCSATPTASPGFGTVLRI